MQIAVALGSGGQYGGRDVQQGGVVYVATDDVDGVQRECAAEIQRRGVDPAAVRLHFITGGGDIARLGGMLECMPDLALVVADGPEVADRVAALTSKPAVLALRQFAGEA